MFCVLNLLLGLTTKGKVILMSEPNEPGQLAHYIGKVSRSGLEKDERKAENEWLFVGDTVKIAASTNGMCIICLITVRKNR